MLSYLLKASQECSYFNDEAIIRELFAIMFASHETTSKLLCWILAILPSYPEWIRKIRDEQLVLMNDSLYFEQLHDLSNLKAVINEVERLFPPLYLIPRGVNREFIFKGITIPAGVHVHISPLITHRLEALFDDPHSFLPSRFLNKEKPKPFSLIGFGGGRHSCLGFDFAQMEIMIILSIIIKKYNWTVTPAQNDVSVKRNRQFDTKFMACFSRIK